MACFATIYFELLQDFNFFLWSKRKARKLLFFLFSQKSVKKELLAKAAEAHVNGFRRAMAGQGKKS